MSDTSLMSVSNRMRRYRSGITWVVGVVMVIIIMRMCITHLIDGVGLIPYIKTIRPGMSYEKVSTIIPSRYVVSNRYECTSFASGTYITMNGVRCVSCIYLGSPPSDASPIVGALATAEICTIYFDSEDKVVGMDYSSSGGSWRPRWGRKIY
jgi:hypothetical protein